MIQIHASLDQPQNVGHHHHIVKQMIGNSKKGTDGNDTDDMENIPAEECRENKVIYRINTTIR